MDSHGNPTDHKGQLLAIGLRVTPIREEPIAGIYGTGTIDKMPKEGSDWYGFVHVRFDHDNDLRWLPDTSVVLVDEPAEPPTPKPDDTPDIAALFALVAQRQGEVATAHALIRALRDRARTS